MVTKVFQLLLLLSPIAIGTNVAPEMFDMIFFRLGVVALFMASLVDKPKREMPQDIKWAILSLLGLVFINVFIHTFAPVVMMHSQNLFLGLIGFYIVYIYSEIKDFKKYILWTGLINLLFFISQQFNFDPVFGLRNYETGEKGAFLGNKQCLMTYFALITSLSLNIWLLIGAIILGVYTKQYVIFIPIFVALFINLKTKKERIGIGIITLLAMIALKDKILYALNYRFNIWKPALQLFFDRSFLGYGLGVKINDRDVLGNSYLQFIMGVGILGVVWFGYVFRKLWKAIISDVVMLSLALIMCVEYVLEIPRLWYLVMAIIIMFLIKQKGVKNLCE